jgi:hypothetical protein
MGNIEVSARIGQVNPFSAGFDLLNSTARVASISRDLPLQPALSQLGVRARNSNRGSQ